MNFFRNQRLAHRQTLIFLLLFMLTVALVVGLPSAAVWYLSGLLYSGSSPEHQYLCARYTALVVLLTIVSATITRGIELRREGGTAIARHLGCEPLPIVSDDPALMRFRNVAEEMAIASRTPMPTLYWMPHEASINAFVAGYTHADAVLAVTHGALNQLNRDELQGVIAHEFSHLLNGDMRMNTRISSWIHGVYAIYVNGCHITRSSEHLTSHPLWAIAAVGLGLSLIVLGLIGKLGGRILQAAISRQREYLADASAVQFTRQPLGLAGALKKIYFGSSLIRSPHSATYSHFFIGNAISSSRLFASHPPLIKRIRVIDPRFNPTFERRASSGHYQTATPQASPMYFAPGSNASAGKREAFFSVRDNLAFLFAALLNADDEAVRQRQFDSIDADWGKDMSYLVRTIELETHAQDIYLRLTRLRLMLVNVHTLSGKQQQTLRKTLFALIAADDNVSLLEVAISYLFDDYLRGMKDPSRVREAGHLRLKNCEAETALVQSLVANNTTKTPAHIVIVSMTKTTTTNAHANRQVFDRLNLLTFDEKKNLFQMLYDACGTPSEEQLEILSLLAACLHAPPLDKMIRYPGDTLTLV